MEKAIVVLGNGFDLDLGWKTSYGDYYNYNKDKFDELEGNEYVKEMCQGEHWYNLEGYLREKVEELEISKVHEFKDFWQICYLTLMNYLNKYSNFQKVYKTNTDSCAYSFLQKTSHLPFYSFNYTNPFEKIKIDKPFMKIEYIHGNLEGFYMGVRPKLGIDLSVKNELVKRKELIHLLKAFENDRRDILLDAMMSAEMIVLYGLSLGITDSDYFKAFFNNMTNNTIQGKRIYIVTYNAQSFQSIKNNMAQYGINYDDMSFSNNEIKRVFTERGKEDKDFLEMLVFLQSIQ